MRVVWGNSAFWRLLGRDGGALTGCPLTGFFLEAGRRDLQEKLALLKEGTVGDILAEAALSSPGEGVRWIRGRIDRTGAFAEGIEYLGGFEDISDLRLAREKAEGLLREAENASRELKEFTSIVSHDLKAPLRGISSLAGWIRDDFANVIGDEGRENLDTLIRRVQKMHAMIEGIVRYSRQANTREGKTPVDIGRLLEETLNHFQQREGVRLVLETPLPVICCGRNRLGEVFEVLLSNAMKAVRGHDGEIRVGARLEGPGWRFWVGDNGKGIPSEHQERIFKLFQKVSPDEEGIGVGLTLARKIVELEGGELVVESVHGQGAVFSFTIPSVGDEACIPPGEAVGNPDKEGIPS
jgi:signal transduction histidine kinase